MSTSDRAPGRSSHAGRILTIARNTFTQLMRMKVFYFMAVFAVVLIIANFLDLSQLGGPESQGIHALRSIKSCSLAVMMIFGLVLAVVATALLLPKDVEDRTLYTILAKPVPRLDYLAGKLLGVLALILVSLLLMDLLMIVVLHLRTQVVLSHQLATALELGWDQDAIDSMRRDVLGNGVTWSLQAAVLAVFLKSAVMAAMCLMVSTFSTSTLFTAVVGFLMFFIAHFQADAREMYLHAAEAGQSGLVRSLAMLVSLIVPDFQLFNVVDALNEGRAMPLWVLAKLSLVSAYHVVAYTLASWWIFSDKEV